MIERKDSLSFWWLERLLMFIQLRINQKCVATYTRSFAETPSSEEGAEFYENLKKACILADVWVVGRWGTEHALTDYSIMA
jgi:hypothetical protein